MSGSLIAPEQHWLIWAALLGAAAVGLWAERTRWGARISGAVITIFCTFLLSNLGVLPVAAPAYDVVWSFLVPLAIPMLLFQADLRRILREAGPTLIAFAMGAVGTVLGTILAYSLIPLGPEGYKLASIFCATYVGGSMNYAAAAEAIGLRAGDLLTAGVAADNLVMTLYFLVLFALPSVKLLRRIYPARTGTNQDEASSADPAPAEQPQPTRGESKAEPSARPRLTPALMLQALALGAAFCAVGYGLATWAEIQGGGILIVTASTVAVATLWPKRMQQIQGADQLGMLLMQIFFAVIGASAHIGTVLRVGPLLFVFAALILLVHLAFLLVSGKLLKLDLHEIVIASNANMGGPTTAAAMAASRGWSRLIVPAILCGTLGYAVATFIGVALGTWLGR